MADDDVVDAVVVLGPQAAGDRDAGAGRGLAGDRQVAVGDDDLVGLDDAAHLEHDDARARGVERGLEGAGAAGGERRDLDDLTTAATVDLGGEPLGPAEGGGRCAGDAGGGGESDDDGESGVLRVLHGRDYRGRASWSATEAVSDDAHDRSSRCRRGAHARLVSSSKLRRASGNRRATDRVENEPKRPVFGDPATGEASDV